MLEEGNYSNQYTPWLENFYPCGEDDHDGVTLCELPLT